MQWLRHIVLIKHVFICCILKVVLYICILNFLHFKISQRCLYEGNLSLHKVPLGQMGEH